MPSLCGWTYRRRSPGIERFEGGQVEAALAHKHFCSSCFDLVARPLARSPLMQSGHALATALHIE
jgi:hypothetical protein